MNSQVSIKQSIWCHYRSNLKDTAGCCLKEKSHKKFDMWIRNNGTAIYSPSVLIFYCCIANYHKPNSLKLKFPYIRSPGMTSGGCNQCVSQAWGLGSSSKHMWLLAEFTSLQLENSCILFLQGQMRKEWISDHCTLPQGLTWLVGTNPR